MPLHREAQALVAMVAAGGNPPIYQLSPAEARAQSASLVQFVGEGPAVHAVEDVVAPSGTGGVGIRCVRPEATEPLCTVVYLHGGGWVLGGGLERNETLGRKLAVASRSEVALVDYRLAPEHPHPAAVEDVMIAIRWAAERAKNRPLIIAGDSAGGNLAAVCALLARDAGGPRIDAQISFIR